MCEKYWRGPRGKAALCMIINTQLAESLLLPLPLPLLLEPLLLLTSQMATLGLTSQLPGLTTNKNHAIQPPT